MATIYRFIIEQKEAQGSAGRNAGTPKSKKGAGKKSVSLFGGSKGGVEHNRYMRAINPVLNKATNGVWEKSVRVGRAAMGLIKVNPQTGAFAGLSGTAIAIIIAFILQTLMKWQNKEIQKAEKINAQNYKQLENGFSAIHGAYKVTSDFWTGRYTYNENK